MSGNISILITNEFQKRLLSPLFIVSRLASKIQKCFCLINRKTWLPLSSSPSFLKVSAFKRIPYGGESPENTHSPSESNQSSSTESLLSLESIQSSRSSTHTRIILSPPSSPSLWKLTPSRSISPTSSDHQKNPLPILHSFLTLTVLNTIRNFKTQLSTLRSNHQYMHPISIPRLRGLLLHRDDR